MFKNFFFGLLTVSGHSEGQAFLEPAELAPVPVDPVDDAALLSGALIVHYTALGASKESFAAFTRDHSVVDAAAFVPANFARNDFNLGWKEEKREKIKSLVTYVGIFLCLKLYSELIFSSRE